MIISLISALYLLNVVSAKTAYAFLYISGILLIAGEIAFTTYGLVGFNGALAIYVAYVIHTGDTAMFFGLPFDWSLLFGLAFLELFILTIATMVVIRFRKLRASTGKEAMIGQKARIINWSGKSGTVLADGENWKAESDQTLDLQKDETVIVSAVDGLTLKIKI
jgi:membrane-bound serine protease (ClpP class)